MTSLAALRMAFEAGKRAARKEADNNDSAPNDYPDDPNSPGDGGDDDDWETDENGKRRRKSKKKADEKDWPTKKKPIDDEDAPPGEKDTSPDRHPPHGYASEDQVILMEIKSGYRGTPQSIAKQIILCGKIRRGEAEGFAAAPPIKNESDYGPGYSARVKAAAAMIIEAGRKRRGKIS
jgi:hypothetical protein